MEIVPSNNNIENVFSSITYYIDFYQRDYKWSKDNVISLLDDIFHKFNLEYNKDLDASDKNIDEKYTWYYLNTYVTNKVEGKNYIVDGQQRLTTLTLILIKLYHLSIKNNSVKKDWIKNQICGSTPYGRSFWMGQNGRVKILENLFENDDYKIDAINEKSLSIQNIYANYQIIKKRLDIELDTKHKFETFSLFFSRRIVLINLDVNQTDVPMVFEVINDRGERLKPYEILKGKLLGQINKNDVDKYNKIWEEKIHALQALKDEEVDNFFRFLFRAKYVNTRAEYTEFDGDYHKTIFTDKWDRELLLKRNPEKVKIFVKDDFNYFIDLYTNLLLKTNEGPNFEEYLLNNSLNDLDRQYLLILSSCIKKDPNESCKIKLVSKLFDKYFTLLNLNGCYDSNYFTESIIELNKKIRNKNQDAIEEIFNQQLINDISFKRAVKVTSPFIWNYFKDASYNNLPIRFLRYFFARIEHFISKNINSPCINYYNLVRNTGFKTGYHIEHIMANNTENLIIFGNDEELFQKERNRLGGLLLLKGKDNISSGAEKYENKLETYVGTNLFNQTLLPEFYHSNIDFRKFITNYNLEFKPIPHLNINTIEKRTKLLFGITKLIWG